MASVEKAVVQSWIVCKEGLALVYRDKHRQWGWIKVDNPLRPEQSDARRFDSRELAQRRAGEHGGSVRLLRWFADETEKPQ